MGLYLCKICLLDKGMEREFYKTTSFLDHIFSNHVEDPEVVQIMNDIALKMQYFNIDWSLVFEERKKRAILGAAHSLCSDSI
ncbi:MAG: hypothetical protein ACYCQJ_12720 [Nitrososphaerales archaeon]